MSDPTLFDGRTIEPHLDNERLNTQIGRVYAYMKAGAWLTLADLAHMVGGSEAGVSARLRDLRKPWWGEHTVETQRVGNTFKYRLTPSECGLLDGHRNSNPRLEARHRVVEFLDARKTMRGTHPEIIYGLNTIDGHFDLLVADLEALIR